MLFRSPAPPTGPARQPLLRRPDVTRATSPLVRSGRRRGEGQPSAATARSGPRGRVSAQRGANRRSVEGCEAAGAASRGRTRPGTSWPALPGRLAPARPVRTGSARLLVTPEPVVRSPEDYGRPTGSAAAAPAALCAASGAWGWPAATRPAERAGQRRVKVTGSPTADGDGRRGRRTCGEDSWICLCRPVLKATAPLWS